MRIRKEVNCNLSITFVPIHHLSFMSKETTRSMICFCQLMFSSMEPMCYKGKSFPAIRKQITPPLMRDQAETAFQELVLTLVLPPTLQIET